MRQATLNATTRWLLLGAAKTIGLVTLSKMIRWIWLRPDLISWSSTGVMIVIALFVLFVGKSRAKIAKRFKTVAVLGLVFTVFSAAGVIDQALDVLDTHTADWTEAARA